MKKTRWWLLVVINPRLQSKIKDPLDSLLTPASHSPQPGIGYKTLPTIIGSDQQRRTDTTSYLYIMERQNFTGEEMMKYEIFLAGKLCCSKTMQTTPPLK